MAEEIHGLLEREPDPSARSGGAAPERIHGDAPLLKQPFWDVDAILVLLAPSTQVCRLAIPLCREPKLLDAQIEFSGECRGGGMGRPQLGFPRLRSIGN